MFEKTLLFIVALLVTGNTSTAFCNDVVIHSNNGHGNDHVYFEPPTVTYDDDLNELHVYFGSTSTINIEYTDPTGTPYYYVYGESHVGYTATTYYGHPEIY